jgi:hypothetical protein
MAMEKVKDYPHLLKDPVNGGVINNDINGFSEYKKVKQQRLSQIKDQASVRDELNSLKQEISEIKSLLLQIASR